MRRRVWNLGAAVSAATAVALLLLWSASYFNFVHLAWEHFDPAGRDWREFNLHVKAGRLTTWFARRYVVPGHVILPPPTGLQIETRPAQAYFSQWMLWLFRFQHGSGPGSFGTSGFVEIGANLLVLAALASVLPIVWRVQHRRRLRLGSAGHCSRCGYDLQSSPNLCPECGLASGALGAFSGAADQRGPADRRSTGWGT